uniref:Uncharacterized protein n=1 Tax=Acrobeloides nanus TaxID=290746 RepID=A0A914EID3_9BILA
MGLIFKAILLLLILLDIVKGEGKQRGGVVCKMMGWGATSTPKPRGILKSCDRCDKRDPSPNNRCPDGTKCVRFAYYDERIIYCCDSDSD